MRMHDPGWDRLQQLDEVELCGGHLRLHSMQAEGKHQCRVLQIQLLSYCSVMPCTRPCCGNTQERSSRSGILGLSGGCGPHALVSAAHHLGLRCAGLQKYIAGGWRTRTLRLAPQYADLFNESPAFWGSAHMRHSDFTAPASVRVLPAQGYSRNEVPASPGRRTAAGASCRPRCLGRNLGAPAHRRIC